MRMIQHSMDLGSTDLWTDHSIQAPDTSSTVDGVNFVITPSATEDDHDVEATIPASAAGAGPSLFMRLLAEPGP